jgi:hypothetical protein
MITDMNLYRRVWFCDLLKTHKVDKYPKLKSNGVVYSLWDGKRSEEKFASDAYISTLVQELG